MGRVVVERSSLELVGCDGGKSAVCPGDATWYLYRIMYDDYVDSRRHR